MIDAMKTFDIHFVNQDCKTDLDKVNKNLCPTRQMPCHLGHMV